MHYTITICIVLEYQYIIGILETLIFLMFLVFDFTNWPQKKKRKKKNR